MFGLRGAIGLVPASLVILSVACARVPQPGDPLTGLDKTEARRFAEGRTIFERSFTPADGLGPLFNAASCAECHEQPVTGGNGDEIEVHATALLADGRCDALADQGGPVVQQHTTPALEQALGLKEEPVPSRATATGRRTTPDLFGLGLLDAVPEKTILELADPDDRDHDGISGRPNRSGDGRIGRFGRKAFVPTLREFTAGALLFEQGITSPPQPAEETVAGAPLPAGTDPAADPELDQDSLDRVDFFVRTLAPPGPLKVSGAGRGRRLFGAIGCASCHVPVLRTGDSPIRALAYTRVAAYTDLLLHDMGPDLADICLGLASPSEFRTEPLMGLRLSSRFLHDGRAATLEEAIHLHGGEAQGSRDRFAALPEKQRRAILAFLSCL